MADHKLPRLLCQHEDLAEADVPDAVTSVSNSSCPLHDQEPGSALALAQARAAVAAESTAFTETVQRLADAIENKPAAIGALAEPVGWLVALLGLWLGSWPLSILCGYLAVVSRNSRHSKARAALEQRKLVMGQHNVAWVGPLAVALASPRWAVRAAAADMLLHALPLVTPSDVALLDSCQRGCLYRRLIPRKGADPALIMAILDLVKRVGDTEAIPYVEQLARETFVFGKRKRISTMSGSILQRLRIQLLRQAELQSNAAVATAVNEGDNHTARRLMRFAERQVDAQLKLLEQEEKRHQQPGMRIGFLAASWGIIVPFTVFQLWHSLTQHHWPYGVLWGLVTLLGTQLHRLSLSPTQTDAARKLAKHNDVRGVGRLAEALEWPDPDIKIVAARALTRILPRLCATDAGLLSSGQRTILYRRLSSCHSDERSDLQIAILKALQQVGDEAAVPHVERLAGPSALGFRQKQVQQAAIDCLPFLIDRAAQLRVSQSLLRASSATPSATDGLLRPADGDVTGTPDHLLRTSLAGDSGR